MAERKCYVAFLPSNQHRNVSTVKGYESYNEAGGMAFVAPEIVEECERVGLVARWFPAKLDTQPGQTYAHQWIYEQVEAANRWLDSCPGLDADKVIVHGHTDSGTHSHTYGIYTTRWPLSKRLATMVGRGVHEALGTEDFDVFDKRGGNDYNEYVFALSARYTVALIEFLSHQNERDMKMLYGNRRLLSIGMANGLREFFGLEAPLPPPPEDERDVAMAQALALLNQAAAILGGVKK